MVRDMVRRGLLVLLLVGLALPGFAQTVSTGSVQGTIKDSEGLPLPGATVTAYSSALVARKLIATSDERGLYRFPSLPSGSYDIEAELSGFQSVRKEGIHINLGQALSVDFVLGVATVKEAVTVTGEAPIVSVVANSVSTNFDQEYLDKQPLPRNFYSIIGTAPGVNAGLGSSGSAMLAYGGTTENQNSFTMDGVNVADAAAGQHWILPSIQWMEEIQVGGLGANAEYGGYTGGVINGVTKSGGNEFHGGLEYYYQPDSWTSDNDPTTENDTFKFDDTSLSVGGPVSRDKLWFFVSAEYWHQVTTPVGALGTSDRKIPRYLGKLTFQPDASNRIWLMGEYDAVTNDRRGIDAYTYPEATWKQDGPGVSGSLNWESLINASNFINLKLTGYDGRDDYLPYHGTTLNGRVDDGNTGIAWQNATDQELNHRHVVTFDGSWSLFTDGLFSKNDSHSFKFGANYENGSSSDIWLRNGGFTYYDDSSLCDSWEAYQANPSCGPYYTERGYGEYNEHPKYNSAAVYAQDSMRLDRWTINYGVRWTQVKGGWQSGYGDSTVYNESFFDPRIGFVWDVTGDARTALKVHWGRYHDKIYTYLFDREASGHAAIPDQDCYWSDDTQSYSDCDTPTVIAASMGKIDQAYVDETLLTVEHQLSRSFSMGLDLMDRRFRSILAMVNTNDDYELTTATGNPLTGGTLPVYDLLSDPNFQLTTDNGGYRDMRSATLRVDKRYANGWSARSSLVWTDMKGNIIKNNGYEAELADKNGFTNSDGNMANYSEWEFKLSGAVDLPLNFQFSGQYTYLSGQYWTPYVRIRGLDYNASTGNYIWLTKRGSEQLPDRNLIDLRLAWRAKLGGASKLELSLECFNVLNSDTVLSVSGRWGDYRLSNGTWTPRSAYGSATAIENPRQLRAGLRLEF
jgi:hypothetical protein